MEIELKWSELLTVMTEDSNGRVRATEEAELMRLPIEEFFIKLNLFKERMEQRIEQLKNKNGLPSRI